MATAEEKLELAERHLGKVREAWHEPDWADLSLYGFYALEAAVDAASIHNGLQVQKQHWARVDAAGKLHEQFGLPDVTNLLRDLNEVRKSEAYGEVTAPELDAEDTAMEIGNFIEAVAALLSGEDD